MQVKTYKPKLNFLTRRGVVWLGQTCNLKCYFCYFRKILDSENHPEKPFMPLNKAKEIMKILRYVYKNTSVDIQGGEPTIYPEILELVKYCHDIGLKPTLITNAIVLDDLSLVKDYKKQGITDFLISVHALGDVYDNIVGVKGASKRQIKAIENLKKENIPFRYNLVLTKELVSQFKDILYFIKNTEPFVVNFIYYNPFATQEDRDRSKIPRYSDYKELLQNAIDFLENLNIEVNIRYFPICILDEKYRKNIYNFHQLPYDHWEWDYLSWTWTTKFNQKTNSPILDEPKVCLPYEIQKYFEYQPIYGNIDLLTSIIYLACNFSKDYIYLLNAKLRAFVHTKYKKGIPCENCSLKYICDGFHGDYARYFGFSEAKPLKLNYTILDPTYYIKNQRKKIIL